MQPSEEQPQFTDENERPSIDGELEKLPEEPQPLYEFPPASVPPPELLSPHVPLPADQMASPLPEIAAETGNTVGTQAGSQGFVYPPPPSFYQNMPQAGDVPPLPAMPAPGQAGQSAYPAMPMQFQPAPVATMYTSPERTAYAVS